ncbi:PD-(D/E)XK nuclease family protein [Mesobacillus maritimus]|uniref:PD-(D/E)XK nuclease family protein n=1 Tax=Mesobacillus maritimus TaxID=1643336 RepID=A0ABS7K1U4_9BACI|nr:PD-(D/E)XK nuclease family protein [Mesobacillus maritimus]MBY0096110.1 PD-(D/E)XK nuclease family protein [Mesobacillus maritimus]
MDWSQKQVTIKTITDYHLESFLRCPYRFYYQHILSLDSSQVKWRQVVQSIINKVVYSFYLLPANEQNTLHVLKLVDHYWKNMNPKAFESKVHYYMVLAKTTDQLLQFLVPKTEQVPPLFLYKKMNTYVEELESDLSLTFELVEWTNNSFKVKKFLVEADEEMVHLYLHMLVVFSDKAFKKLPEKIEIITLLDGKKHSFSPSKSNVDQGILYLNKMKIFLKQPNNYLKTNSMAECSSCPFTDKCNEHHDSQIKGSNQNFLH